MGEQKRDDNYYHDLAKQTVATCRGYYNDDSGWEVAKKTKDILIEYKNSVEFSGHLYRGQSEFNCPPDVVFQYVDPLPGNSLRMKWDKAMKKIETIREISEDLRINRTCTDSACMGLISPRDFLDCILTIREDTFISTNGVSVSCDDECPLQDKYVRGWNYSCGMLCQKFPDKPNHTKLVTLIQPDIKGMCPKKLVDSAIPGSMVDFFTNLRACLKEDGKLVG
ncbi:stAR-related lipid transfer protein 5-like [Haliotis rufescens]|uniref:stAR-related lipid transfer protein 5-like n=1 Tax=Haliotis rufescens TaxID=6454 RepID=UPI001EAFB15B|nr:stAR-related lipid transfer protein 5-like [Haliotis rufescens]